MKCYFNDFSEYSNYPMVIGTNEITNYEHLYEIVESAFESGIRAIDTAPSYSNEEILGSVLKKSFIDYTINRESFYLIDKIDAWQMYESKGYIEDYVDDALKKLKTEYIDVMLIHWPIQEYLQNTWINLIKVRDKGKIKSIGLCNVNQKYIEYIKSFSGIYPSVVQNERHPLRTINNQIDYQKKLNILSQAYSPLGRMDTSILKARIIEEIGQKYNKTIGQIILRWQIDTGVIPVFKTTKKDRIYENLDIFDFQINQAELESISSLNVDYKIYLESWGCPGY